MESICPCGRRGRSDNVQRHMLTCKVFKASKVETDGISDVKERLVAVEEKLEATTTLLDAANQRVQDLTEENASLRGEIKELKKTKSPTVNITNNTTINVNVTPYQCLWSMGPMKDTPKLVDQPPVPDDQVRPLLKRPAFAVPKYIELKYLKTEFPNLRIPNVSRPYMDVVQKEHSGTCRWVRVDKKETLSKLVENGIQDLETEHDAMNVTEYKNWSTQKLPGDEAKKAIWEATTKQLMRDVEAAILSYRGL
jgi:hypothetical protein